MTEERIEDVDEDRLGARTFLAQARRFQTDADGAISTESRSVLLHQAAISAADAILQAAGLRVSGGDGSHQLRLTTALDQLDRETGDLSWSASTPRVGRGMKRHTERCRSPRPASRRHARRQPN
jgi:hypothetical protein